MIRPEGKSWRWWLTVPVVLLAGCGEPDHERPGDGYGGSSGLTVWAHHGKPEEWRTLLQQVDRFQRQNPAIRVKLVEIAEGGYDVQVQSAAATGDLPDVLELDGPLVASYAWRGYLRPLGDLLAGNLLNDLLPSIREQGTYAERLYAVGTFDSGLGIYGDQRALQTVNARIPRGPADAWSAAEFDHLLEQLARVELESGEDGCVLDLKRDYRGEWWTYAFYPLLISAGADLIEREQHQSAEGVLNGPAAVAALTRVQGWVEAGLVDPNVDGRAFVGRKVALSWAGHWEYPRYRQALGGDLLVLPLPDFGGGSRTGLGSWCWSLTRQCRSPAVAAQFLEFLLAPEEVLAMSQANGAVPATRVALQASALYRPGGPLQLFARQLQETAVSRPKTPAYPVITSAFQAAMLDILSGAEVKPELDAAVRLIDRDIRENEGYPLLEPGR